MSNVQKLLLCCRHKDRTPSESTMNPLKEYSDQETISEVKCLWIDPHTSFECPQTQLQSPMSYGNCDRNLTVGDLSTRVF